MEVITCYDVNDRAITHFTQWEYGIQIIFDGGFDTAFDNGDPIYADFCNDNSSTCYRMDVSEYDTGRYVTDVPNALLQNAQAIYIFIASDDNESGRVIAFNKIPVRSRVIPDDYVATDNSQVVSLTELSEEMEALIALFSSQEEQRIANENTRVSNEETRESNEETREDNEAERQANEEVRIANEEQRQADHEKCIEATDAANAAAEDATEAAEEARAASRGDFEVTFDEADEIELIQSGESLSVLFGKIQKYMDDVIYLDSVADETLYFKSLSGNGG